MPYGQVSPTSRTRLLAVVIALLALSASALSSEPLLAQDADPQEALPQPVVSADPGLAPNGIIVSDGLSGLPKDKAKSFIVADLDTGEVIAAKNAHVPRLPASTQKMLTALTLLPLLDADALYTATPADVEVIGSRVGLREDSTYRIRNLFEALFLRSGNDAATALANANGGAAGTVEQMNVEAMRLGALNTTAMNTHGLDEPGQSSSAYDLALIARAGMQIPSFRELAALKSSTFPGDGSTKPENRWSFEIGNQNYLLWDAYEGAIGIKSGFTTYGGRTFATAATRGDKTYLVTLMGIAGNTYRTGAAYLDWAFANGDAADPVGQLVEPGFEPTPSDAAQVSDVPLTHNAITADAISASGASDAPSSPGNIFIAVGIIAILVSSTLLFLRHGRGRPNNRGISS